MYLKKKKLFMTKLPIINQIHDVNKNGAAARNTGIRYSKGQFIAFLDDDDSWLPTKIERQLEFLSLHTEFDAVYTYTFSGKTRPSVIPYEARSLCPVVNLGDSFCESDSAISE